jgi:hypothetical protein
MKRDPKLRVEIRRCGLLSDDPDELRRIARNGWITFIKIENDGFSIEPDLRTAKRLHRLLGKRIAEAEALNRSASGGGK